MAVQSDGLVCIYAEDSAWMVGVQEKPDTSIPQPDRLSVLSLQNM